MDRLDLERELAEVTARLDRVESRYGELRALAAEIDDLRAHRRRLLARSRDLHRLLELLPARSQG